MESTKKFKAVMLIDDNEIDNLINQKMLEASNIAGTIFMHTGAKGALEFLKNMEKPMWSLQIHQGLVCTKN
jgi:hypothetical protein